MDHVLPRRLVWLLGEPARSARLESALAQASVTCERFGSATALCEAIDDNEPQLVLLDTAVFEQPGELEALVERIRAQRNPQLPIVVITDDGSVEMRRRMFKAGVNDFVLEPVVDSELLTRVRSQLTLEKSEASTNDNFSTPSDVAGKPLSILVADAESIVQRVLRSAFERRGWTVHSADDGREALDLSDEHQFDLVVFELNLPFKNGFELLGELGGASKHSRPRMVVLSAEKQQESVLRAFELGADDFVSKPVNPDILVARIERLVRPVGSAKDGH